SVRPSRRGRAQPRRVCAARRARAKLAGRKGAIRLGRPEVLLVQFRLARPGLVSVRLCVAARIRLGRPGRLARLEAPSRPPPAAPAAPPPAAPPPACPSQAAGAPS